MLLQFKMILKASRHNCHFRLDFSFQYAYISFPDMTENEAPNSLFTEESGEIRLGLMGH